MVDRCPGTAVYAEQHVSIFSPFSLPCCRVCVWLASSWELCAEHCLPCPSPSSLAWCSTSPRGISSQTLWVSSLPLKSSSSTLYSVYLDQWIIEINFVWCHWIFRVFFFAVWRLSGLGGRVFGRESLWHPLLWLCVWTEHGHDQWFFNKYCIHLLRRPMRTHLLLCDRWQTSAKRRDTNKTKKKTLKM